MKKFVVIIQLEGGTDITTVLDSNSESMIVNSIESIIKNTGCLSVYLYEMYIEVGEGLKLESKGPFKCHINTSKVVFFEVAELESFKEYVMRG